MSVIGEKLMDVSGRVTSITMTEAGTVVNIDWDAGPLGTPVSTETWGQAVDGAGETGPVTAQGMIFGSDGSSTPYMGSGVWYTSGQHHWDVKWILLTGDGTGLFVDLEYDLATRSVKGTGYALDDAKQDGANVIGEQQVEVSTKVTSMTVTDAGIMVNQEAEAEALGTVLATATFGAARDVEGETGPVTEQGQFFAPDGGSRDYAAAGVWRKVGQHKWETKQIGVDSEGTRMLTVEVWDLATRSTVAAIYSLA